MVRSTEVVANMATALSSSIVQNHLQNVKSLSDGFVQIFSAYQEQLRINRELRDQNVAVLATHELLSGEYDDVNERVLVLESMACSGSDGDTCAVCSIGRTEGLEPARTEILEKENARLTIENQRIQIHYETMLLDVTQKHKEALSNAGDLIIASTKKIDELEAVISRRAGTL